jgi:hypothetical protein
MSGKQFYFILETNEKDEKCLELPDSFNLQQKLPIPQKKFRSPLGPAELTIFLTWIGQIIRTEVYSKNYMN